MRAIGVVHVELPGVDWKLKLASNVFSRSRFHCIWVDMSFIEDYGEKGGFRFDVTRQLWLQALDEVRTTSFDVAHDLSHVSL